MPTGSGWSPRLDYMTGCTIVGSRNTPVNQCSRPTGWFGRFTLWRMNSCHSKLTDWCVGHISMENHHTILFVVCGGGLMCSKLLAFASMGVVYGVYYIILNVETT